MRNLRVLTFLQLSIALVMLGGLSLSQARDYPAIGPLPAIQAPDAAMIEMGERLFFDVRLSG